MSAKDTRADPADKSFFDEHRRRCENIARHSCLMVSSTNVRPTPRVCPSAHPRMYDRVASACRANAQNNADHLRHAAGADAVNASAVRSSTDSGRSGNNAFDTDSNGRRIRAGRGKARPWSRYCHHGSLDTRHAGTRPHIDDCPRKQTVRPRASGPPACDTRKMKVRYARPD